jgi:hypothetical protein
MESARNPADTTAQLYPGRHGWVASTFGQNSNGGYSQVVLDLDAHTLSVKSFPN